MTILKTFKTSAITQTEPAGNYVTRAFLLNSSNNKLLIESPNQDYLYINNQAYDYLTFVNDWQAEPTVINNLRINSDASRRWFVPERGMISTDNYHFPLYHSLQQSLLMTTRLSMSKNLNPIPGHFVGIATYSPSPTNLEGYFYSLDKSTYYKNAIISKLYLSNNQCTLIDCSSPNILNTNGGFKASNFILTKGYELYNNINTSSIGKSTNASPDVFNSYIPVAYNETLKKIYCIFEAYTNSSASTSQPFLSTSQLKVFNYDFLNDGSVSLSLQTPTNWGTNLLNQAYLGTAGQKDFSLAGVGVHGVFNKHAASTAYGTNHSSYMGKDNTSNLYFLSTFNHMRTTWNSSVNPSDFNIIVTGIKVSSATDAPQYIFDTGSYTGSGRINRTGWYDAKAGSCFTYCNIPSKFENSPLTGESNIYYSYIPAFADTTTASGGVKYTSTDTTTYFTPILVKWNKSINPFGVPPGTNAITIKDCNIVYDAGDPTKNWFTYANVYNTATGANIPLNSSHVRRNSQCFVTKLNNTYYLNFIQCLGYKGSYDFGSGNNLKYRIVTYTIGNTNWENLTFHSSSQLDDDVLSFLPIDETLFTKIMCLHNNSLCFYTFTSVGWNLSYKEVGSFRQVTRDQLNRVWAYTVTNDSVLDSNISSYVTSGTSQNQTDVQAEFNVSLHLISESLNNVIQVRFEENTQNYTGVDISSNVYVSVFDENGSRIAANVQLTLEGANTLFVLQNSSTTYTTNVTTLQASDLAVPIKIVGPGYANVYANVIF